MRRLLFVLASLIAVLTFSCDTTQPDFDDSVPGVNTLTTTVSPEEGGEILPSDGEFVEGTTIEIEAVPNTGFTFDRWEGDLVGSLNPTFLSMTNNRSVTAVFSEIEIPLTINIVGEGSVEQEIIEQEQERAAATLTTTLKTDESADTLSVNRDGGVNKLQREGNRSIDESVDGSELKRERPSLPDKGIETTEIPQQRAETRSQNAITTLRLTAVPDDGWRFARWEGDLTGSQNPDTLVVETETVVTAVFEQEVTELFTLELTTEGQGFIEAVPDKLEYTAGEEVTLTATPEDGWDFSQWGGDLSGSENPETIIMDADKQVSSVFVMEGSASMEIVQQPSETIAGESISPAPAVRFTDSNGEPEQGINIQAALNAESFSGSSVTTISTNADGVATFDQLSVEAAGGNYRIEFEALDSDVPTLSTSQFAVVAAAGNPEASSATVADGIAGEPTEIIITVNDRFGNPVTGAADDLEVSVSGANSATPDVTEGEQAGQYIAEYTPQSIGSDQITVMLNGTAIAGTPVESVVTASDVSGENSSAEISPEELTVGQQATITVTARDDQNNPLSGIEAEIQVAGAGDATVSTFTEDGQSGVYTATIISTVPGDLSLTVTVSGVSLEPLLVVTFLTGTADSIEIVSGNNQSSSVASELPNPVVVRVTDAFGNPVEGETVTFTFDETPVGALGQSLDPESTATDANGEASSTVTLGIVPGTYSISASAGSAGSVTFTAEAQIGQPSIISIIDQPVNTIAGDVLTPAPSVEITDSDGNGIEGVSVNAVLENGEFVDGSVLTSETNSDGIARFENLRVTAAGTNYSIRFEPNASGLENVSSETFEVTAATADPASSTATVPNGSAGDLTEIIISVQDEFGNPVDRIASEISLSVSQGANAGATFTSVAGQGNGTYQTGYTPSATGTDEITIQLNGAAIEGSPFTSAVVATDAENIEITSQPQNAVAGVVIGGSPAVLVTDNLDNPISNVEVTVTVDGETSIASGTTIVTTDNSGIAQFDDLVIQDAGTYQLRFDALGVTDDALSNPIEIAAAAADAIVRVSGDGQTAAVNEELSTAFTVQITDAFENPIQGETVNFAIESTPEGSAGASLSAESVATNSSGNASSLLTLGSIAGSYTVSATSGVGSVQFTATAAAGGAVTIEFDPIGSPQIAGNPFVVSLTAFDANGNLATGYNGTATLSTTAGSVSPGSVAFSQGEASANVTVSQAGDNQTITAEDGDISGESNQFDVNAGGASQASIVQQPTQTTAGQPVSPAPSILVEDSEGNPVEGVNVTVSASGEGLAAGSTNDAATNSGGVAEFGNLIIESAGAYTLSFDVSAAGVSPVQSGSFDIVAAEGDPNFTDASVPDGRAGEQTVITITVQDQFENRVAGAAGLLAVNVSGANSTSATVSESGDGIYTATYTPLTAGTDNIEITLDGTEISRSPYVSNITTSQIDGDESTVTASPTSLVVGNNSVITVELSDANGNEITSLVNADFDITVTGNATAGAVGETSDAGTYRFNVSNTRSEQVAVSVVADGISLTDSPQITFTAGEPDLLVIVSQPGNSVAGNPISNSPAVRVTDEFGNNVPDLDIDVEEQDGQDFASGTERVATNNDGIAQFTNLVINEVGRYNLVFSENTGLTVTSNAFNVNPGSPDADETTATVPNGAAGDVTGITITVRDAFQNRVEGATGQLSLSVSGSNAGAEFTTVIDEGNGVYSTAYTPTSTGTDVITIQLGGADISGSPYSSEIITSDADEIVVLQDAEQTIAGEKIQGPPTVEVLDDLGNPVNNVEVVVSLQGSAAFDNGNTSRQTNGSGVAEFNDLVIETAGSYTLIFNAIGVSEDVTSSLFEVIAADANALSRISGNNQSGTVTGTLAEPFVVRVADEFGNPVQGAQVEFEVSGAPSGATGQNVSSDEVTSDADGLAQTTLTLGSVTGTYEVRASVSGAGNVTFSAVANAAAASAFTFDSIDTPQVAGQPFSIRIVALDSQGNTAAGYQGTADLTADSGSIIPGEATFANGIATLDVTLSAAVQDQSILAVDGSISGQSNTFDVQSGGVSASNSSVSVSPSTLQAGESSTLTIVLRDGNNNAVSGLGDGDFSITQTGDAGVGSVSESTAGTYSATITNETAELVTVTVNADGVTLDDSPEVTFTAADAANLTLVSGNNQSGAVTQQLSADFVVNVKDAFGNNAPGEEVQFAISSIPTGAAGQSLSSTSVQTGSNGNALSRLTLGDTPGEYTVNASVSGAGSVTFTATAQTGAPSQMTIVTQPENSGAGQPISPSPQIRITDNAGNAVSGASITVREEGGYTFDGGTITQTSSASGIAIFDDLIIESSGQYALVFDALASGVPDVTSDSFIINPGQGSPSNSTAVVPDGTAGQETEITIEVADEFNNPVGGAASSLSVAVSGSNSATPTVSETTVTGIYSASYTPIFAGSDNIAIEISDQAISGSPFTSNVTTSGISSSESSVVASPTSLTVGNSSTVSVLLRDEVGNAIAGLAGADFTITASGDATVGTVNETATDGTYEFNVRNTTAQTVSVSVEVNGVTLDDTPQIVFQSAAADDLIITTNPGDAVAGTVIPGPPSVLIEDRFENPVPGVSVTVSEQSGESFASGTATIQTNASGVAAFDDLTINAVGQYNLVFSSSGLNNQTSNAFDITAAAADAAQTTATVPNGSAGAATTITVSVNDAFGNPVTGVAGDLEATVSGANSVTISSFTDNGDGTYSAGYTPTLTGDDTIAITLGGTAIQGSPFTSTVETSGAANVAVATQPTSTIAGQVISGPPTAEVNDSESNAVSGVDVVASLNTGSFASGQTTVSSGANGQSAFSDLVITTAGAYTIEFNAQGVSESATTQAFDITPAAASELTIESGNNQSGTVGATLANPFVVLVADEFGNTVAGEEVTFEIASTPTGSTGSSLTEATVQTDANGLASTSLTLGNVAGSYDITASADGLDTVTFTATATAGSVSTFAFESISSPQTAGSPFEISIDALDSEGNIVSDYSGTPSLSSSSGSISPNSATFTSGEATLNVSVSDAGDGQTITATDGSITGTSNTFDVQSGDVDAGNSLVSASPLTLQAGQSSTLTIELRDGSDNPVGGLDAGNFNISLTGDATAGSVTESTAGTYTSAISNETAETTTATVTVSGTQLNETPEIEFAPADADPAATTANVPNGAAGDATSIVITVSDAFGNPVTGAESALDVSVSSGPNAGETFTAITDNSDGSYTTSYTPESIGTDEITITLNSVEISGSPYSSTVTTSDVSASNSSATASPTSLVVGNPSTVTVELRDGSNNPIAGLSSSDFNVSASGSATTSAVSEISGGTYEFTVSNEVAESVTVTVTATGTTLQDTPNIEFTVGATATVTVTNQPTNIVAGQTIAGPPAVTLEDEFDNPVSGISVTVSEQGGESFESGTLTVQTNASGVASFTDLVLTSAGQYNLVFNEPGGQTATSNAFEVSAAAGNAAQTTATVPNGAAGDATSITVSVNDEFGNPVTGVAGDLEATVSGANSITISSFTDNDDGTYTTSYTPESIGTDEISITLNSVEISGSPYSSTVTTSDVSASNSSATASPTTLTVGSPSTVTVVLRDGSDNPITGLTSSNFDVNPSGSATASTVTETPTAGTYEFTVSNQTAESVTVTISATGTTINDAPAITFIAGTPERLIVSTQPLDVTAGESIPGPPSVTLEDQFANPVPSVDVTVSEQGGQSFASGTLTVQTNASGAADFTDLVIADAGEYNLVFTATGGETATSNVFEVSPADGDASQTTATVPNGSAGDATTITVSVNDAFGNSVTGAAGDLEATVSGANTASISTFTDNGNGTYSGSYTPISTGDDTIAITLGGAAIQGSPFTSTVITSDAAAVEVAAEPLQTVAGQPVAGPPAALVTDDLSNPVSGIDVVASLSTGSFASGTSTVNSDGNGESLFDDLVITRAGSYTINFNAQGVTDAATTTSFDVIPAAASNLVIDSGNNQTATVTNTLANPLTVQVSDEFGNPVEGESVSFAISDEPVGATGQSLSATSVQTGADGLASVTLTTGNLSGDYSVTASGSGLGSVVFTATANAGAASVFSFDTITSPQTAGSGFTISLTAQDSEGNTSTNYSGTATLTTIAGTITPSTVGFTSGTASVNVTVSNAGDGQTITAEDGSITGTSNTFDVSSGGIDAANSSVTASPLTLQAGQSSTLTIELRDGSNNPVGGVDAGSFTVALSGDATAGTITEGTSGTYTTSITNQTAETVTATVTVSGTQLNDIPQIEFTAGSLAALTLLSGDNQTGTVAEQLPADFVVEAEDSFGNPVSGVQVNFAIDQVPAGATGQSLTNAQILTGSLGRAFTRLTLGDLPGTYTVDASATGVGSVTYTAQAEIGEASIMSITSQPGETTAGNAITPSPEVTVTDDAGNPIDGVSVSVSEQGGYTLDGGTLSVLTGTDGTAAFNDLVVNTADNYTLVFDADAPAVSDVSSNPFDVVAAAGDPLNSTANVPDGAAGDPTTITISVWDQFNNPVTGVGGDLVISFVAGPNSTSTFSTITDNGNGTYTTSYTPSATGTDEISITLNGTNIAGTTYFSAVATSDVSASNSSVTASPGTLQAGSNSLVTVEVRDGSNNAISELTSSDFSISVSGDGTAGAISETATDGIYQFNISNTTAEQVSVSVTATGTTLLDSPTITFTAAAADLMLITQQPLLSEAGQPIAGPPTARITDEFGNRVPNVEVTISEQGGQPFTAGSVSTLNTNSLGQAIFDNIAIELVGEYNLVFSVDGITNRTSNLFAVTESDPNAAQTTASVPNGSAGVRTQISITVRDAFGNRVEGASSLIGVQISGANDSSTLEGILDNGDGVYSTAYTPSTTGTDFVAIDIDGTAIPGSPFSSEVSTSDADSVAISQQPLQTVAGNSIAGPPSVIVTDQFGNNVSGIEVTVRESGGADFDTVNLTAITDVNGEAIFSDLQINDAGTYTLIFDAVGVELDATSDPFSVVPAAGDAGSTVASIPAGTAGEATTITVNVQDIYGNGVEGAQGDLSVSVTSGANTGAGVSSVVDQGSGIYTATYTPTVTGTDTLTVTLSTVAISNSPVSSVVSAGAASTLEISQQPTTTEAGSLISPSPTSVIRDSEGNGVPGINVTATLSADDFTTASTATVTTDSDGIATFDNLTIETAATGYTITFGADAAGVTDVTSNSFDITAASATAIGEVNGSGQTQEINTQLTTPFEVRVVDNFGNAIAGEDVSFTISDTPEGAAGQSITNLAATSDANGLATTTLTLGDTAGTYSVEALFNGVTITFTAEATNPI